MYQERRNYQIVLVAVIVMLILALLINSGALAKSDKPDKDKPQPPNNGQGVPPHSQGVVVPHHNKPDKVMTVNCHSRHAREAGQGCDQEAAQPASEQDGGQSEDNAANNDVNIPLYLPLINGGGGGCHTHVMM